VAVWSCYLQEDGAAGQDAQLAQVQVILPQIFAIQKEDLIVGRHFEHLHDLQHTNNKYVLTSMTNWTNYAVLGIRYILVRICTYD
jgi:hypothetical protein